ncbi:MAG: hypothetical protein CMJ24_11195 [Phycisphaerae bacterium]|jgi:type II secretory pathway pseudopilin PulG|nr:hypothetical protein [Phycisphaerae bacterium]|tara:strand:- start:419 stop:1060 length:642 start_codon:yes stop_codon:yes gene_type:complete
MTSFHRQSVAPRHRRGFTLLETILAISITAMVGLGIATMMAVLGSDASMQFDLRSVLVRSGTAQSRLSAYIAPARCILDADENQLVLWFDDTRQSDTVHASEIRWITYEPSTRSVRVEFISFPDAWSESATALADLEYGTSTDWGGVLQNFSGRDLVVDAPLIDEIETIEFLSDESPVIDARVVETRIAMATSSNPIHVTLTESIRMHHPPEP